MVWLQYVMWRAMKGEKKLEKSFVARAGDAKLGVD